VNEESQRRARRRLNLVVGATFLANGMILGAVPQFLRTELGANKFQTGLGTTGFFVAALIVRPFSGPLMNRFGRRPFIRWTLLGLAISTVGYFAVGSIVAVSALRLVQGVMGSLFYVATLTATTELAAPDQRAAAVARLSVTVYLGFIFGPLIADLLIHGPGFAWAWASIVGLYALAFVLGATLSESRDARAAGASPEAPNMFFHRASVVPGLALFATAVTFSTVSAFLPDYSHHIGLGRPGWLLASYSGSVLLVRLMSGSTIDKASPFIVAIPGFLLGALGLTLLATSTSVPMSFAGIVLAGLGSGSTFPALIAMVVQALPDVDRAVGLASLLMFNDFGQALAGPAVGGISDHFGWRWVYGVPALLSLGSVLVLAWALSRRRVAAPALV
jgi:MFS family permease